MSVPSSGDGDVTKAADLNAASIGEGDTTRPSLQAAWRELQEAAIAYLCTPRGMATLFGAAALLRLLLAPHFAFYGDIRVFISDSRQLHEVGLSNFEPGEPVWYGVIAAIAGLFSSNPGYLLIKAPTIVADLLFAWVAGSIAAGRYNTDDPRRDRARLLTVVAVLFNPAVLAVGVMWGQIEMVPVFFAGTGLLLLINQPSSVGRDILAMFCFAFGFSVKPQASFLAPVVLYVLIRRYVLSQGSPLRRARGGLLVAAIASPGVVLFLASGLPFGIMPSQLIGGYVATAGRFSVTSANAFNLWGIFAFWRSDSGPSPDRAEFSVYWLQSRFVGYLLFAAGVALVIGILHNFLRQGREAVGCYVWASATVSMIAFTFLTRMHERFMFSAVMLATPLVIHPLFRRLHLALSMFFVGNLWYAYTVLNAAWKAYDPSLNLRVLKIDPIYEWLFGDMGAIDSLQRRVWSGVGLLLCVTLVAGATRWLGPSDREATADGTTQPNDTTQPAGALESHGH